MARSRYSWEEPYQPASPSSGMTTWGPESLGTTQGTEFGGGAKSAYAPVAPAPGSDRVATSPNSSPYGAAGGMTAPTAFGATPSITSATYGSLAMDPSVAARGAAPTPEYGSLSPTPTAYNSGTAPAPTWPTAPGTPDPTLATGFWPEGLPRPPAGMQPGTQEMYDWFVSQGIDPHHSPEAQRIRALLNNEPVLPHYDGANVTTGGAALPGNVGESPIYVRPGDDPYASRDEWMGYLGQYPDVGTSPGWPSGMPHPPPGVLPGTPAYYDWLQINQIDPESPLNNQIKEQLFYEQMGGFQNPQEMFPELMDPAGFSAEMEQYLAERGLGVGDNPDTFDRGAYGEMLADSPYAALNAQLEEVLGRGGMAYDPTALQTGGLAQVEIARQAAERSMGDRLASSGLLGQANQAYTEAPLYGDYMMARSKAMTDPLEQAYALGPQMISALSGGASSFQNIAAQVGMSSADLANAMWTIQQKTAMGIKLAPYEEALSLLAYNNDVMRDLYDSSRGQSNREKGIAESRDSAEMGMEGGIWGSLIGLVGSGLEAAFS